MYLTRDSTTIGIDVSSQELSVYVRITNDKGNYCCYENTRNGILELIKDIEVEKDAPIVMESTGRYHSLCAIMLHEHGHKVHVINPLRVKKYQTSAIRKTKTDKIDAKLLSEVALLEPNLPTFNKSREEVCIRQKISLLNSMEKQVQKMKATVKNYAESLEKLGGEMSTIEDNIKAISKALEKEKKKLEKEIIKNIKDMGEDTRRQCELLENVPGISEFMACLAVYFYSLDLGKSSEKWVAYTGMDISIHESGKWKGRGRLSKRGNKYLRKRWFSCGWGSTMHNEDFKNYYDTLKEKGRSHTEALNMISRKLLRISFALLKKQEAFNPQKTFSS